MNTAPEKVEIVLDDAGFIADFCTGWWYTYPSEKY
jgi:hypothetical protein